jgi:hypothetical protein
LVGCFTQLADSRLPEAAFVVARIKAWQSGH